MNKVTLIFKSFIGLVRERKLFILIPILTMFALLAFLVYYIGPTAIISFIYAGI